MRVIGGSDYYDAVAAYGIDESVLFVRTAKTLSPETLAALDIPDFEMPRLLEKGQERLGEYLWETSYTLHQVTVLLAGKWYCGVRITGAETSGSPERYNFWSDRKLNAWATERGLEFRATNSEAGNIRHPLFTPVEATSRAIGTMVREGIVLAHPTQLLPASYRNEREDEEWEANDDALEELGFQSMVDPMSAAQEISMWISNTLIPGQSRNAPDIMDDGIKIAKHGMDEWSFRKKGSKRK